LKIWRNLDYTLINILMLVLELLKVYPKVIIVIVEIVVLVGMIIFGIILDSHVKNIHLSYFFIQYLTIYWIKWVILKYSENNNLFFCIGIFNKILCCKFIIYWRNVRFLMLYLQFNFDENHLFFNGFSYFSLSFENFFEESISIWEIKWKNADFADD
jgi:hypothetical protein